MKKSLTFIFLARLALLANTALGAGIYYVATNGNDAADGTSLNTPWRTISKAAATLESGDAVYIRGGIYRETILPVNGGSDTNNRVTYSAYRGEKVVISGADIYTNWTKTGSAWSLPWTTNLDCRRPKFVFRREMVIVDGRALKNVGSFTAMLPGTFYVDGPSNGSAPTHIYMRTPEDTAPAGHIVECAWRYPLFHPAPGQGYFHVVGLTFTHSANRGQWAMASFGNQGSLVESNIFEWSGGLGVSQSGLNHVFLHDVAQYNGEMGWGGASTNNLIQDCKAFGNNWKEYDIGWEAGGGKWVKCVHTTIRRFESGHNDGPGIWLDWLNVSNTIEDCFCYDNQGAGIMLELNSNENIVRNCVVHGTRWFSYTGSGILSQASANNTIEHNTIVDNAGVGIFIRTDKRGTNGYNRIYNNLLQNNVTLGLYDLTNSKAQRGGEMTIGSGNGAEKGNRLDGNIYYHPNGKIHGHSFFWGATSTGLDDLSAWRLLTGSESHSIIADPLLQNWQDATGFHLTVNSPARGLGVKPPLPVTHDYYGDPRPPTGADSGADQYTWHPVDASK